MKKKINLFKSLVILTIMVLGTGAVAGSALAGTPEDLTVFLGHEVDCSGGTGELEFSLNWEPAEAESYIYYVDFGDGDSTGLVPSVEANVTLSHSYIDQGDYEISVEVFEVNGENRSGELEETLTLEGPEVSLTSVPSPPVFVVGEDGQVAFTANATEGTLPYTYEWDLDGGETTGPLTSETAAATYTEAGKYHVKATVTDGCGFTASAFLPVVVADPEDACHPTAQKIADAVSSIFPDQADKEYSCEDIYTLFDNEGEENNLGFGRMWMAYNLTKSIELTWEEILAWHMDESGWGGLLQLNRFAEVLEEQGIGDLMALVMSEDYTLGDVRTAIRSVTHFEADFDDALARVTAGATPGELSQFYRLAADLEADYEVLDKYLADGMTLSELKHAASFAERNEVDWTEIAEARLSADSWGDLKQAYSMATDEISAAEILIMGVQEYRKSLREDSKAEQTEKKNQKTAEQLVKKYSADTEFVMDLLNGCEGNWACVRSALRNQTWESSADVSKKDSQTSLQISSKYGYSQEEVLAYYQGPCGGNWSCARAHFRDLNRDSK